MGARNRYFRPMLIPLKDINPTGRVPLVTYALVFANALVFLYQLSIGIEISFYEWGLIPAQLFGAEPLSFMQPGHGALVVSGSPLVTLFTSMFMHGGFLHLAGNMLYLWIFGNNIEYRIGHLRFLGFYVIGGVAATLTHALIHSSSELPLVGASGAVAAVLGAYFILYPRARVRCLLFLFIFFTFIELPAFLVLGWWIFLQVVNGFAGFGLGTANVAWFAHIGGFFTGILLLKLMGTKRRRRPNWT